MKQLSLSLFILLGISTNAQIEKKPSFPYAKVYSLAMGKEVSQALHLLDTLELKLNDEDLKFKNNYEQRFKYERDLSGFLSDKPEGLKDMLSIFQDYWRNSLLVKDKSFERQLGGKMMPLIQSNPQGIIKGNFSRDSIGFYLSRYIRNKGFYTEDEVIPRDKIVSPMIWKSQKDTTYTVKVNRKKIDVKTFLLSDFVTHGWMDYATLGAQYPGGWATKDAIFCVEKAYDLESEKFRISLIKHESIHFLDYQEYPHLDSADMEYRAKLVELCELKDDLYTTLTFFIDNADCNSLDAHPRANYFVVRDLSREIFTSEFVNDIAHWQTIKPSLINKKAKKLLRQNNNQLKSLGREVRTILPAKCHLKS